MDSERNLPIAVIGDTQNTSPIEKALLFREQNDREREQLLRHLLRSEFEVLVHLGDMVVRGSSARAWKEFDRLFAPVRARGVSFLPLMGNHEYWGNKRRTSAFLAERFPEAGGQRWRACVHGNVGLILLDSNISHYARSAWANQINWFESTIQDMEQSAAIAAILVFAHHPPFTNSAVIRDASFVQTGFLPAFFASRKTVAFISGHVHGYERFVSRDKTFIVSGGGGGPRLRLHQGRKARHEDQFQGPALRPFHYLLIHPATGRLRIESLGLEKGEREIRVLDEVDLRYR